MNERPSHHDTSPLISVRDLHVSFKTDDGLVEAVRGLSFDLGRGETLGIVGESGSGKSVTNLALMGLIPRPPGRIDRGQALFHGEDLLRMSPTQLMGVRGRRIGMIFQDPMTALNPLMTVGQQLTEMTQKHLALSAAAADARAAEMLELVGISNPGQRLRDYPHQFSGGMRQRVMIAMALSCEPDVLIADEPTTALDVTVQAQVLELLTELRKEFDMSMILVTHDLGVVAGHTDQIAVMYAGDMVEYAPTRSLFANMKMPYTEALLKSIPRLETPTGTRLPVVEGRLPDPTKDEPGCAFANRCEYVQDKCRAEKPPLKDDGDNHFYRCWFPLGGGK